MAYQSEGMAFDCSMCLETFQAKADVIQLGCNSNHVFHRNCVYNYIEAELEA